MPKKLEVNAPEEESPVFNPGELVDVIWKHEGIYEGRYAGGLHNVRDENDEIFSILPGATEKLEKLDVMVDVEEVPGHERQCAGPKRVANIGLAVGVPATMLGMALLQRPASS